MLAAQDGCREQTVNWNELLKAFALPNPSVAQMLHNAAWVAVFSWLTASLLPLNWRPFRWLLASVFWAGLMALWDAPLFWLGLAFQSPSLLTLCLCVMAAWVDMRITSRQIFLKPEALSGAAVVWLGLVLFGWALVLDLWGWWPTDLYLWGFTTGPLWLAWGMTGVWMGWVGFQNTVSANWHSCAATCVLMAGVLFVLTHAPTGNAWDALLDPWLWLYAHLGLMRSVRLQRTRISHS